MKCRLCQGNTIMFSHPKTGRRFQWCATCDGIQVHKDDLLTEEFEYQEYSKHENSMENEGYVEYLNRFIDESIGRVKAFNFEGKGLDFGSGPGPVLKELLSQRGLKMQHYDPYFHPVVEVLEAEYDLVTSTEVVEHFYHPSESFDQLIACVQEGGYLVLMTSFHYRDLNRFLNWWYIREKSHVFFYTEKTMAWIGLKYGLKLEYTNHKNIIVFRKEERH